MPPPVTASLALPATGALRSFLDQWVGNRRTEAGDPSRSSDAGAMGRVALKPWVVDGEVQVRGPMLLRCYRDGTDPKTADGWLPTGDAGELGDDGVLHVHGRRGDLIVTGGENVWPVPVEEALRADPTVADVAVAGAPDPEWGHRVVAHVVPVDPAAPPTLDALRARVKATLPAYMAPRELVLHDALPRTSIGKIRRSQL